MSDLTHLFEVNALFEDVSLSLNNYLRDSEELILSTNDAWYVGYYKPVQKLYFNSDQFNINANSSLSFEYWDGSAWVALPNLIDETKGLTRNGFINWSFTDKSKTTESWQTTAVNGLDGYWIKISAVEGVHGALISASETGSSISTATISDNDISLYSIGQSIFIPDENSYHTITDIDSTIGAAFITFSPDLVAPLPDNSNIYSTININALNIVFSDDNDLLQEVRLIDDYRAANDSSFIAYHTAARNDIVQTIRNGGDIKIVNNQANQRYAQMNKWDILEIGEIRQAAKYLCLAKIFFDVSENKEDKPYEKYRDYMDQYGMAFKLYFRTLDIDDDGNIDDVETTNDSIINFRKV